MSNAQTQVIMEVGAQATKHCTGCAEQFTIIEAFVFLAISARDCTRNEPLETVERLTLNCLYYNIPNSPIGPVLKQHQECTTSVHGTGAAPSQTEG